MDSETAITLSKLLTNALEEAQKANDECVSLLAEVERLQNENAELLEREANFEASMKSANDICGQSEKENIMLADHNALLRKDNAKLQDEIKLLKEGGDYPTTYFTISPDERRQGTFIRGLLLSENPKLFRAQINHLCTVHADWDKIAIIKEVRAQRNLSLKDAKDWVDANWGFLANYERKSVVNELTAENLDYQEQERDKERNSKPEKKE